MPSLDPSALTPGALAFLTTLQGQGFLPHYYEAFVSHLSASGELSTLFKWVYLNVLSSLLFERTLS